MKYIGETSRNAYSRGVEHLADITNQHGPPKRFCKHHRDFHPSSEISFKMNVNNYFRDDAMIRQISESIAIEKTNTEKLINTKKGK